MPSLRHEREDRCTEARTELRGCAVDICRRYELTRAEGLRVVNEVLAEWISGVARILIREERHGDVTKPGNRA
jgi:hypothetical protein